MAVTMCGHIVLACVVSVVVDGFSANCTTISIDGEVADRFRRNASRTTRFTRLRSTARFSRRLPMMKPRRAPPPRLLVANGRKTTASCVNHTVRTKQNRIEPSGANGAHVETAQTRRLCYTDSRLRPFALRALMTLRPFRVAMHARNPVRSFPFDRAGLECALHEWNPSNGKGRTGF